VVQNGINTAESENKRGPNIGLIVGLTVGLVVLGTFFFIKLRQLL